MANPKVIKEVSICVVGVKLSSAEVGSGQDASVSRSTMVVGVKDGDPGLCGSDPCIAARGLISDTGVHRRYSEATATCSHGCPFPWP